MGLVRQEKTTVSAGVQNDVWAALAGAGGGVGEEGAAAASGAGFAEAISTMVSLFLQSGSPWQDAAMTRAVLYVSARRLPFSALSWAQRSKSAASSNVAPRSSFRVMRQATSPFWNSIGIPKARFFTPPTVTESCATAGRAANVRKVTDA